MRLTTQIAPLDLGPHTARPAQEIDAPKLTAEKQLYRRRPSVGLMGPCRWSSSTARTQTSVIRPPTRLAFATKVRKPAEPEAHGPRSRTQARLAASDYALGSQVPTAIRDHGGTADNDSGRRVSRETGESAATDEFSRSWPSRSFE